MPEDATLADRYSGGEVVDHFHRFAFVGPTRNHRTLAEETWYLPDGSALSGPPTAQDIAEHVAELPAEWLKHLSRPAREYRALPEWEAPASYDAGEVAPWLLELAEQWGGVERYPDAQRALWDLAWIAVLLPETPGIDTLRGQITDAYVNRPDTSTPQAERMGRMDRLWQNALPKQAEQLAELEAEIGRAAVDWALPFLTGERSAQSELERLESLTPEQAEAEFGYDWQDLHAQAINRAKATEARASEETAIPESWKALDLSEYLEGGYEPPKPSVFLRDDGIGMFYPGVVNEFHATPGTGKTLFALAIVAEQLGLGESVLYLDYEEHPGRITKRLLDYGVPVESIRERFHYVRPEERPTLAAVEAFAAEGHALVVIDTVGESINNVTGGDSNSTDDVTRWHSFIREFARGGACVLVIDHITKDAANPLFPIGSQAKLAGYKGAVYLLEAPKAGGPRKGSVGLLTLKLAKDNGGGLGLRKNELAAEFVVDSTGDTIRYTLRHPEASTQIARHAQADRAREGEILSAVSEHNGPMKRAELREALGLYNDLKEYGPVLAYLIESGRLVETPGAYGAKLLNLPLASTLPPPQSLGLGESGDTASLSLPKHPQGGFEARNHAEVEPSQASRETSLPAPSGEASDSALPEPPESPQPSPGASGFTPPEPPSALREALGG
ncbi:AAA family ATPase [Agromyces sp. S2-1-8]|uniref:AAA family ATPase n=1 Tax=Agromyces sp. S2-1-8 TaxID=2897180 RepID=UPI001E5DA002|nr:AAA family ATPase [Agromyces sp. S2-1-8]MCD5346733.1 helicase RepA family protein [Agromyces sp. S2-1-8]